MKNQKKKLWHSISGDKRKIFLLLAFAFCVLFFSAALPGTALQKKEQDQEKKQDSLAVYLDRLFDYTDAYPQVLINGDDSLMQTVWRQPETPGEKLSYYNLLINIAYHLLQYRQIPASIKWYERAYQFYEQNRQNKMLEQEMYFEEYIGKPLGNNYTRMGDFSKAIFIQQSAIQSALQKKIFDILPGLYGNLATSYFHMYQYDSARHYINLGLMATPKDHPQILNLYNLRAEAFLETGQKDSAAFWNNKAMLLANNSLMANADAVVITILDKARILNQSKAHSEAVRFLQAAWEMTPQTKLAEKVEIAIEMGNAFLLLSQTDSSIKWHKTALSFFRVNEEGLYPDFKVTTALFGIATALMYQSQDSAAIWFERAILNDYYTQQLLPATLNSQTAAYANSNYSEVAIALHHQLYDQTKNKEFLLKATWLAELSKGRQLLSEQKRSREWLTDSTLIKNKNLVDELKNLYLSRAETGKEEIRQSINARIHDLEYQLNLSEENYSQMSEAPSYSQFKNWLVNKSTDATLLSYYWGRSYIYCTSIGADTYRHFLDSAVVSREHTLKLFLNHYFYQGPDAFNNDPSNYFKRSHSLLQQWNPWFKTNFENIYVSADGLMHALPFEALSQDSTGSAFLGEKKSLIYNFSFLQNALQPHSKQAKEPEVNIITLPEPHKEFAALPESENEKNFLSGKYKSSSLSAASVDVNKFLGLLQSGQIMHFASHAVAGDSATENFLLIKEKLYLSQIQYTPANCPLLVLAACETGAGQLKEGEGMESLGRIFISKGVDGVISTRWPIDDKIASDITKKFYSHLNNQTRPAEALQLARKEYIQANNNMAAKNPWLWSAFVYHGVNDFVVPAAKFPIWIPVLVLGAILLAFLLKRAFR